jgi:hypothetical protein
VPLLLVLEEALPWSADEELPLADEELFLAEALDEEEGVVPDVPLLAPEELLFEEDEDLPEDPTLPG